MAGAPGFEPGIAGPKPAALPLGYAALWADSLGGTPREEQDQPGDREQGHDADRERLDNGERDRDCQHDQLRRREDPRGLPHGVRPMVACPPPDAEGDDRDDREFPEMQDAEEVEKPLDRTDPERDAEPAAAEPSTRTTRSMLDRAGVVHRFQPYHAGMSTHPRPTPLS